MARDLNRQFALDMKRVARREHRGPLYRRALFWLAYDVTCVIAVPFAAFGILSEVIGFIADAYFLLANALCLTLERWAYPGMKERVVLVHVKRERKVTHGHLP